MLCVDVGCVGLLLLLFAYIVGLRVVVVSLLRVVLFIEVWFDVCGLLWLGSYVGDLFYVNSVVIVVV